MLPQYMLCPFVCMYVKTNLYVCLLGYIVGASPPVRICAYVRWVTLWVHPPPLYVRSIGVGVLTPHVCPFIGRQSSLDPLRHSYMTVTDKLKIYRPLAGQVCRLVDF